MHVMLLLVQNFINAYLENVSPSPKIEIYTRQAIFFDLIVKVMLRSSHSHANSCLSSCVQNTNHFRSVHICNHTA